ncbi:capsid protein [Carnobacterium divergens]|uniref:phage scaffolding protein n=1 Tax=Carnobacterium divergens TaxID=2748 RepID=UPI0010725842|nr:phage scaffolding protein [Carnobacterium divergens]TFI66653.1 capsid protein [Carnobacterium divergens]TFI78947.1 capsid protein [Carnobacterium divergens]TFI86087.1 capsid protein [Carnobacterium divergens]TFI95306.1 capsid protein [Carnobacterium divergens]TFI96368.1 capsid protein [Carnobacterium divergens]
MKKEDLIALGIEEEAAKSIMALHGKTVTQLNAQVATAEGERDQFKEQLETNQSELNTLKESAKDNEELTKQLAEFQVKMDTVKTETETKLLSQQKDFAIQSALKEANALDATIVLGLLDKDTIKVSDDGVHGLKEQLDGLKESKSFLFEQAEVTKETTPAIVAPGNPTGGAGGGKSIVQKIQERLGE